MDCLTTLEKIGAAMEPPEWFSLTSPCKTITAKREGSLAGTNPAKLAEYETSPFLFFSDVPVFPATCLPSILAFLAVPVLEFTVLINIGFTDTVKYFIEGNTNWTFWGYRGGGWQKGNGLRIDHFLTTPELTDIIKDVKINRDPRSWEKASDHTPVILEI